MDDPALQNRLAGIERRQQLIIALLVGPYLAGSAYLVGVWVDAAFYTVVAVVLFVALAIGRRRDRDATGQ
ncbi:hypothetical protein HALDL1_04040 [Halobacterium sp. DL1]|jgi:hypothetical protein|nr:hypothetical protein HALDL1_04040 [Halobacterium sp. DL1]